MQAIDNRRPNYPADTRRPPIVFLPTIGPKQAVGYRPLSQPSTSNRSLHTIRNRRCEQRAKVFRVGAKEEGLLVVEGFACAVYLGELDGPLVLWDQLRRGFVALRAHPLGLGIATGLEHLCLCQTASFDLGGGGLATCYRLKLLCLRRCDGTLSQRDHERLVGWDGSDDIDRRDSDAVRLGDCVCMVDACLQPRQVEERRRDP